MCWSLPPPPKVNPFISLFDSIEYKQMLWRKHSPYDCLNFNWLLCLDFQFSFLFLCQFWRVFICLTICWAWDDQPSLGFFENLNPLNWALFPAGRSAALSRRGRFLLSYVSTNGALLILSAKGERVFAP